MLKGQDCVLLIKLLANPGKHWSQRELAAELFMSQSEVHTGLKRLMAAALVRKNLDGDLPIPVVRAAEEYLIHGIKYSFPVHFGEFSPGIPTGVAAPIFKNKVVLGEDPIPVWPYGKGSVRGVSLAPLYRTVPQSIQDCPDQAFYDLLALVDVIRSGRARERNMAIQMIEDKLKHEK